MNFDSMSLKGELDITLLDEFGAVKEHKHIDNLVVTAGKNWVAALMQSGSGTPISYMAVGTGATSPAAGDTTLQTELARVATTVAGGSVSGNVLTYVANYNAGTGTGALTEAGLFTASSSGTMLSRTTFSVVNKGASDTLQITWTVTVG